MEHLSGSSNELAHFSGCRDSIGAHCGRCIRRCHLIHVLLAFHSLPIRVLLAAYCQTIDNRMTVTYCTITERYCQSGLLLISSRLRSQHTFGLPNEVDLMSDLQSLAVPIVERNSIAVIRCCKSLQITFTF